MSQDPCFPSGAGQPRSEPLSDPNVSQNRPVGQTSSASHASSRAGGGRWSGRLLQPAPVRGQNPLKRSLLQQLRASLAVCPDKEVVLPVLAVGADLKQHALLALFSQRYELSLMTECAARDLGFEPLNLPPGLLNPFICPLGRISPERYVGLVVEQARNNLSPTAIGNVIVLDSRFNDRGPDLYLGRRFLQDFFDGNLPPKASDAGGRRNARHAMSIAQIGINNVPGGTPLMTVGTSAQQLWRQTEFGWPGEGGGNLLYPQSSEGFASQSSVLPVPQIPMAGSTNTLSYAQTSGEASSEYQCWFPQSTQLPEEHVPGSQEMPPWNTNSVVPDQSSFAQQTYDPSFGTNGGWMA